MIVVIINLRFQYLRDRDDYRLIFDNRCRRYLIYFQNIIQNPTTDARRTVEKVEFAVKKY